MISIYQAKDVVNSNLGSKVWVKVRGLRSKNELIEGVISECYKIIFVVKTVNGNRSFSYSDYLIGNISLIFN